MSMSSLRSIEPRMAAKSGKPWVKACQQGLAYALECYAMACVLMR